VSFILDALRKSEHERQRGAVPGISNVPFAAPRRETPRWMFALVAVLVLAVMALGGAWWRSSKSAKQPAAVASVPLDVPPPAPAPTPEPRAARSVEPPSAQEPRPARAEPPVAATAPAPTVDARPAPLPQTDLQVSAPARAPTSAARDDDSDMPPLPSPMALSAQGVAVPQLHLELHAYSDRPAERFVFINGRKYVEGEQLSEGPRVVSIERTGAVLSLQGRRFLLTQ
jgi:general secretion pathway protein B